MVRIHPNVDGFAISQAHLRGMLRDERIFKDAEAFNPARYITADGQIDPSVPNPDGPFFGFGRRACVGKHFADAAVWLTIATVLSCFNISPSRNERGEEVIPKLELRDGFIT